MKSLALFFYLLGLPTWYGIGEGVFETPLEPPFVGAREMGSRGGGFCASYPTALWCVDYEPPKADCTESGWVTNNPGEWDCDNTDVSATGGRASLFLSDGAFEASDITGVGTSGANYCYKFAAKTTGSDGVGESLITMLNDSAGTPQINTRNANPNLRIDCDDSASRNMILTQDLWQEIEVSVATAAGFETVDFTVDGVGGLNCISTVDLLPLTVSPLSSQRSTTALPTTGFFLDNQVMLDGDCFTRFCDGKGGLYCQDFEPRTQALTSCTGHSLTADAADINCDAQRTTSTIDRYLELLGVGPGDQFTITPDFTETTSPYCVSMDMLKETGTFAGAIRLVNFQPSVGDTWPEIHMDDTPADAFILSCGDSAFNFSLVDDVWSTIDVQVDTTSDIASLWLDDTYIDSCNRTSGTMLGLLDSLEFFSRDTEQTATPIGFDNVHVRNGVCPQTAPDVTPEWFANFNNVGTDCTDADEADGVIAGVVAASGPSCGCTTGDCPLEGIESYIDPASDNGQVEWRIAFTTTSTTTFDFLITESSAAAGEFQIRGQNNTSVTAPVFFFGNSEMRAEANDGTSTPSITSLDVGQTYRVRVMFSGNTDFVHLFVDCEDDGPGSSCSEATPWGSGAVGHEVKDGASPGVIIDSIGLSSPGSAGAYVVDKIAVCQDAIPEGTRCN